jgi:hypothetical protein
MNIIDKAEAGNGQLAHSELHELGTMLGRLGAADNKAKGAYYKVLVAAAAQPLIKGDALTHLGMVQEEVLATAIPILIPLDLKAKAGDSKEEKRRKYEVRQSRTGFLYTAYSTVKRAVELGIGLSDLPSKGELERRIRKEKARQVGLVKAQAGLDRHTLHTVAKSIAYLREHLPQLPPTIRAIATKELRGILSEPDVPVPPEHQLAKE